MLTLVFAFRSSAALAYAFGMAVTGTITITTLLFLYVRPEKMADPAVARRASAAALLLFVDLLFVAANLTKLVHGAWLPLLIGVAAFTVMTTWQRGREVVTRERETEEGPLREFVDGCPIVSRGCYGCRARRCSSTAARRQRRWRCGRTSTTTTCSTSTCHHGDRNRAGAARSRTLNARTSTRSATPTTGSST